MDENNNPLEMAQKKKWLNDKKVSRDITQKILKFGVSQTQIRNIIFLLSLELENVSEMKAISSIINGDGKSENTILIPGENNE